MKTELTKRILSGIAMLAVALFCLFYHPLAFLALLLVVALLMYAEWLKLTAGWGWWGKALGVVYVGVPIWSMMLLRGQTDPIYHTLSFAEGMAPADMTTPYYVLFLLSCVWVTDIAAYFGGKWKGKHKLAPAISPGKTWEGLGFGASAAALMGLILALYRPDMFGVIQGVISGASLAVVSQMGDLFESWLKRRAGVKDSGTLIPGHGGVLDRVDGLTFAAPVFAALML